MDHHRGLLARVPVDLSLSMIYVPSRSIPLTHHLGAAVIHPATTIVSTAGASEPRHRCAG
jgi:hypothetical protein